MSTETKQKDPITRVWPAVLELQFDDPGRVDTSAIYAAMAQANEQVGRTESKPVVAKPHSSTGKYLPLPANWQN